MAWNGTGTYVQVTPVSSGSQAWTDAKAAGDTTITTSDHDYHDQDVANGITNCIAKDGQNSATANLPMGGFKHTGVADASSSDQYASYGQLFATSPMVGSATNQSATISSASATATFTAEEIIVAASLGGRPFRIASFSQAVNLGTTGAGGMDTGSAPVSGYVALYAILISGTNTRNILAVDCTSAAAPTTYGGANMPVGYDTSALISVWPTDSLGRFIAGYQVGRTVRTTTRVPLSASSTQHASLTSLDISSAVPKNANMISGFFAQTTTVSSLLTVGLSGASFGATQYIISAAQFSSGFSNLPLSAAATMYYIATVASGTMSFTISITGYSF